MLDMDTDCPACGGKVRFSLQDVAKGRTVRCSRGHSVTLKDEGGGAAQVDRSLRDLDKSIRDLNRKLKF